jgi:hypothetical protein
MPIIRHGTLTLQRVGGACLALMLTWGCLASTAHASCGDYVVIGGMRHGGHVVSHDAPATHNALASPLATPRDSQAPCRGLHCSKGPHRPASSDVPLTLEPVPDSGCLLALASSSQQPWKFLAADIDRLPRLSFLRQVYRPPR